MKNNKVQIDLDIEDLLGLKETSKNSLEYDLNFIIDNGMEKYLQDKQQHEEDKAKFIELFKECYDEIVKYIELDPKQRIAVDCFTCIKGMDLTKQYGKPKRR